MYIRFLVYIFENVIVVFWYAVADIGATTGQVAAMPSTTKGEIMSNTLRWDGNGVILEFTYGPDEPVCMSGYEAPATGTSVRFDYAVPIVEITTSDSGHWIACDKLTHTTIGRDLRYVSHRETSEERSETNDAVNSTARLNMKRLEVDLLDASRGITATVVYETVPGCAMVRTYAIVGNNGAQEEVALESVTSLTASFGIPENTKRTPAYFEAWSLHEADMDWLAEGRWHTESMRDLFPTISEEMTGTDPRGEHQVVSTGTWSTGKYAPLMMLTNAESGQTWIVQVEHNGAWRWEIGQDTADGYIAAAGPEIMNHDWQHILRPGEQFTTVPASFVITPGHDDALEELTAYRRAWRAQHNDNARPSIVFNDYMNTINGNPTTEKLLPLIEAAAEVGTQIFVIDCGWYDDTGNWWPSVGEWMPSKKRFPGPKGIVEVIDSIRDHGMIPGIWLEPEVVGVLSPIAEQLPDSAFIQRNGKRVEEQQRYLLDFRSPAAVDFINGVVDRLVTEYGIGYFKLDYNISPRTGSDTDTDSCGDALLEHNRAYSVWISSLLTRYPDLIIENCSSGGMREDFAQTSRFQVQSTSDQQDWKLYPAISAAAPMLMLPEQAANWAYPNDTMTDDETVFTMTTSMLGRLFVSGYINRMDSNQLHLVSEAIDAYRTHIQPHIGSMVPFWPVGLPGWRDGLLTYGLRPTREHVADTPTLVAAWIRDDETEFTLPVPHLSGCNVNVEQVYPVQQAVWETEWRPQSGELAVRHDHTGACAVVLKLSATDSEASVKESR